MTLTNISKTYKDSAIETKGGNYDHQLKDIDSDLNKNITNFFELIKNRKNDLIKQIKELEKKHNSCTSVDEKKGYLEKATILCNKIYPLKDIENFKIDHKTLLPSMTANLLLPHVTKLSDDIDNVEIIKGLHSVVISLFNKALMLELNNQPPHEEMISEICGIKDMVVSNHQNYLQGLQQGKDKNVEVTGENDYQDWQPGED